MKNDKRMVIFHEKRQTMTIFQERSKVGGTGRGGEGHPTFFAVEGGGGLIESGKGRDGDGKRGQEIRTVKEGRLLHQQRLDGKSNCGEGVVPAVGT